MARLEDAGEGEGAVFADEAAVVGGVGDDGLVAGSRELLGAVERDVKGDILTSVPFYSVLASR